MGEDSFLPPRSRIHKWGALCLDEKLWNKDVFLGEIVFQMCKVLTKRD